MPVEVYDHTLGVLRRAVDAARLGNDDRLAAIRRRFARVERPGTVSCRYCMPYENDKPVWIARGLRQPLAEIWDALKHYN